MSRYQTDPTYRQAQIERSRAYRARQRVIRQKERRLNGWQCISGVPRGEVVKLYDPAIFWPIYAQLIDDKWVGLHYQGPINPTHFQRVEKLPR